MKRVLVTFFLFIYLVSNNYTFRYDYTKVEKKTVKTKVNDEFELKKMLIESIMFIESTFDDSVINKKENAVGILQIRPIMVKDINENILKKDIFTLDHRFDSVMSVNMFIIYQNHYNPKWSFEKAARIWNGGPNGMNKSKTKSYYNKVLAYGKRTR